MVEPISMTIGTTIGLAGLYSVCLQAMDQVDAGKTLGEDSQKLLSMFEAEKFLFKEWGGKVGIGNRSKHHRCLDEAATEYPIVHSILQNLQIIWDNADTLSKKYGLKLSDVAVPSGAQKAAAITQQQTPFRHKIIWALKDKKKFERLLADLGAFIEKLYTVASLDEDAKRQVVEVDDRLKNLKSYLEDDARQRAHDMIQQQQDRREIKKHLEDQERQGLLDWVGAVSTDNEYDEALRERHQDTCTWIHSNEKFLDWLRPHTNGVLWFHGGPGTGKTFMSASTIEYLKKYFARPTAFFFCTHEDSRKNQTLSILRSLVVQLASQSDQALEAMRKFKASNLEPVPSMLWDIFRAILAEVGPCHLVIDGFDECLDYDPASRARRQGTMKMFLEELLQSTRLTGAKVLIISRNLDVIRSSLETTATFSTPYTLSVHAITEEDTAQDILSVSRAIADSKVRGKAQRDMVVDQLSTSCQGMFLWIRLEGERLHPGMRAAQIKKTLTSTPPGLDHAYKRNLTNITELEKHDGDRAKSILRWMLFAFRPLSVKELLHALEVQANDQPPQLDDFLDIDDGVIEFEISRRCGSLVEVRAGPDYPGDRTVHFVHFSAKEFLLSAHEQCENPQLSSLFFPRPEDDHVILTKSCLSYLLLGPRTSTKDLNSFEDYSSIHWTEHFHLCTNEGKSESLGLQKNFLVLGPAFDTWIKKSYERSEREGELFTLEQGNKEPMPLDAACRYGLNDLCKELLRSCKVTPLTALGIAALYGQEALVRLFLARDDVDANTSLTSCGITALHAAVFYGHEAVVQLLLGRDEMNVGLAVNKSGETPLHIASRKGHDVVVGLLLAREDVDVNAVDISGRTPLYESSFKGHEAVVRLLLAREDVDVNSATTDDGRTPLYGSCLEGHEAVVRLLLAREDVDVNAADRSGQTPLHVAVGEGVIRVVRLLLAREDVDVNAVDRSGRTPLHIAAGRQGAGVVRLLLAREDVDVNAVDRSGRTPLHMAVERSGRRLLFMKVGGGGTEVVELLLAREDVDVNAADRSGQTPLHVAVGGGRIRVVRLLLAREDVDVNSADRSGQTPLHMAVERSGRRLLFMKVGGGGTEVVELLLAREDVDVNAADRSGQTPLHVAVGGRRTEVAELLLAREDVDVNAADRSGQTPLHVAVGGRRTEVAELLLAREDVDVNAVDRSGQTPLDYSNRQGGYWRKLSSRLLRRRGGKLGAEVVSDSSSTSPHPCSTNVLLPSPTYVDPSSTTALVLSPHLSSGCDPVPNSDPPREEIDDT